MFARGAVTAVRAGLPAATHHFKGRTMSKPIFWLVFTPGAEYRKFTTRTGARVYAATLRALGHTSVTIKPMGF